MGSEMVIRLDASDSIVFASGPWLQLARETGHPHVTDAVAKGRPFSDFAPDPELGPVYRLIFRRVRDTGEPASVPLRFETSARTWHVDVHVLRLPTGELECHFYSLLIEMPRPELLTQCAWCKRVRLPEARWAPTRELSERMEFFLGDAPRVTHGICPSCAEAWVPVLAKLG